MKIFRNENVKRTVIVLFLLTIVFTAVCACFNLYSAAVVFVFGVLTIIVYIFDSKNKYDKLASFSEQIDKLIYSDDLVDLSQYKEGETEILQCEIRKLLERLHLQTEMLKNDKLHMVDYIADISHQLRTPMTSINLYLASLQNDKISADKRNEYYFEIRKQVERVDWLVDSLLKLARLDAEVVGMKKEKTALSDIVRKSVEPLAIAMDIKEQNVAENVSGYFYGDEEWTVQAVGNIIKNCTEHMNSGTVYITGSENAIYSELIIRDTGAGFDKDDIPHIFERFFKGKNASSKSIGIGLSLSQRIITMQNGTVKAENHKDGGAMFTIKFYKTVV